MNLVELRFEEFPTENETKTLMCLQNFCKSSQCAMPLCALSIMLRIYVLYEQQKKSKC